MATQVQGDRAARRDWRRLTEEFDSESDRASALVAAALLDKNLEELLAAFMIDDRREVEYLLGSGLKSFGARIRICYALGLISDEEVDDMHVVKSVRNYFAHNLHVDFDDDNVQRNLAKLKLVRRVLPDFDRLSARRRLEQTACMLSVMLVDRVAEVRAGRCQRRPEVQPGDMSSQCPVIADDPYYP